MAKTAQGLVEYVMAQLGLPYWYGTYGATASKSLYEAKKKQYPKYYTATDFASQYGKRVHDCVGLIKGYLWSETPTSAPKYTKSQDRSANGLLSACVDKGGIATLPDQPGVLVFKSGHVGVYIGNGDVIEAKGHAYGVVKSKLSKVKWVNWGRCPWIDYGNATGGSTGGNTGGGGGTIEADPGWTVTRLLKQGRTGEDVWTLKQKLFAGGYYEKRITKIASKTFGSDTVRAVKNFQTQKGLLVDGIAGKQTITAMGGTWKG